MGRATPRPPAATDRHRDRSLGRGGPLAPGRAAARGARPGGDGERMGAGPAGDGAAGSGRGRARRGLRPARRAAHTLRPALPGVGGRSRLHGRHQSGPG